MVDRLRGSLRSADAGRIGARAGRIIDKYKMAKHFRLDIADGHFAYQRNDEQIHAEAALDGLYMPRTTVTQAGFRSRRRGARLQAAQARRTRLPHDQGHAADPPHSPPLETRVRAHVLLCMLVYHVAFEPPHTAHPAAFDDETSSRPQTLSPPRPASPAANAGRQRPHHRRTPRPHSSPTRSPTRHAAFCRNQLQHRRQRPHSHPAHPAHRAPSPRTRTPQHQAHQVDRTSTTTPPNPAPQHGSTAQGRKLGLVEPLHGRSKRLDPDLAYAVFARVQSPVIDSLSLKLTRFSSCWMVLGAFHVAPLFVEVDASTADSPVPRPSRC